MLEKYDSVSGIISGSSSKGTFVYLDNGAVGWIKKQHLPTNTRVVCSVLSVKDDGFAILGLDSVQYDVA